MKDFDLPLFSVLYSKFVLNDTPQFITNVKVGFSDKIEQLKTRLSFILCNFEFTKTTVGADYSSLLEEWQAQ